jgi:hypothetical protein
MYVILSGRDSTLFVIHTGRSLPESIMGYPVITWPSKEIQVDIQRGGGFYRVSVAHRAEAGDSAIFTKSLWNTAVAHLLPCCRRGEVKTATTCSSK